MVSLFTLKGKPYGKDFYIYNVRARTPDKALCGMFHVKHKNLLPMYDAFYSIAYECVAVCKSRSVSRIVGFICSALNGIADGLRDAQVINLNQ